MATTMFLLPSTWDLALDVNGNIAVATSTYQRAQDIASACRVFTGDIYFNKTDGIPYNESILGRNSYPIGLYQSELHRCAMSVEGVTSAKIKLSPLQNRKLTGIIEFTDIENNTARIEL